MIKTEINRALKVLRDGGTILYPTDTIWGIGCDATSEQAVDKIYRIKKRMESKSLIILLEDMKRLRDYISFVPPIALDLIENVDKPLTIIYPGARNLARNVMGEDGSVAVRIVRNDFCKKLLREFGKPIVSTSANISGETAPLIFNCISENIKNSVDYVVNLYHDHLQEVKPSRIIRIMENGEFEVIRP